MSNYLSTKKTEKLNDTALGKQVVQNMEDNRSTPHDSAVNNRNYVNTDDRSHKNCDITLLGGGTRKCALMCCWRLGNRKVYPHVFGGSSMDNA